MGPRANSATVALTGCGCTGRKGKKHSRGNQLTAAMKTLTRLWLIKNSGQLKVHPTGKSSIKQILFDQVRRGTRYYRQQC